MHPEHAEGACRTREVVVRSDPWSMRQIYDWKGIRTDSAHRQQVSPNCDDYLVFLGVARAALDV